MPLANQSSQNYLNLCGFIAPIWLLVGITLSGLLSPNYSHYNQAMSELHARGSTIEQLAPVINHYPLSLLFIAFGVSVYRHCNVSISAKISATLIVVHGLATFIAGFFPCDAGCMPEIPSRSQNIHNIAGGILFLSLLLAQVMWIVIALKKNTKAWFGWFTLASILVSLSAAIGMGQALETGEGFGLYQRINYGSSILWLLILAYLLRSPFNRFGTSTD